MKEGHAPETVVETETAAVVDFVVEAEAEAEAVVVRVVVVERVVALFLLDLRLRRDEGVELTGFCGCGGGFECGCCGSDG